MLQSERFAEAVDGISAELLCGTIGSEHRIARFSLGESEADGLIELQPSGELFAWKNRHKNYWFEVLEDRGAVYVARSAGEVASLAAQRTEWEESGVETVALDTGQLESLVPHSRRALVPPEMAHGQSKR